MTSSYFTKGITNKFSMNQKFSCVVPNLPRPEILMTTNSPKLLTIKTIGGEESGQHVTGQSVDTMICGESVDEWGKLSYISQTQKLHVTPFLALHFAIILVFFSALVRQKKKNAYPANLNAACELICCAPFCYNSRFFFRIGETRRKMLILQT